MFEVDALFGKPEAPVSQSKGTWVLMSIHVVLDHVVDLTQPAQQELLGTSDQELTGRWETNTGVAPTQRLGAALFAESDIEGVIFGSSKISSRNLLIFPDKLRPRSSLVFQNEMTGQVETLS
jgi:hypothetical protein